MANQLGQYPGRQSATMDNVLLVMQHRQAEVQALKTKIAAAEAEVQGNSAASDRKIADLERAIEYKQNDLQAHAEARDGAVTRIGDLETAILTAQERTAQATSQMEQDARELQALCQRRALASLELQNEQALRGLATDLNAKLVREQRTGRFLTVQLQSHLQELTVLRDAGNQQAAQCLELHEQIRRQQGIMQKARALETQEQSLIQELREKIAQESVAMSRQGSQASESAETKASIEAQIEAAQQEEAELSRQSFRYAQKVMELEAQLDEMKQMSAAKRLDTSQLLDEQNWTDDEALKKSAEVKQADSSPTQPAPAVASAASTQAESDGLPSHPESSGLQPSPSPRMPLFQMVGGQFTTVEPAAPSSPPGYLDATKAERAEAQTSGAAAGAAPPVAASRYLTAEELAAVTPETATVIAAPVTASREASMEEPAALQRWGYLTLAEPTDASTTSTVSALPVAASTYLTTAQPAEVATPGTAATPPVAKPAEAVSPGTQMAASPPVATSSYYTIADRAAAIAPSTVMGSDPPAAVPGYLASADPSDVVAPNMMSAAPPVATSTYLKTSEPVGAVAPNSVKPKAPPKGVRKTSELITAAPRNVGTYGVPQGGCLDPAAPTELAAPISPSAAIAKAAELVMGGPQNIGVYGVPQGMPSDPFAPTGFAASASPSATITADAPEAAAVHPSAMESVNSATAGETTAPSPVVDSHYSSAGVADSVAPATAMAAGLETTGSAYQTATAEAHTSEHERPPSSQQMDHYLTLDGAQDTGGSMSRGSMSRAISPDIEGVDSMVEAAFWPVSPTASVGVEAAFSAVSPVLESAPEIAGSKQPNFAYESSRQQTPWAMQAGSGAQGNQSVPTSPMSFPRNTAGSTMPGTSSTVAKVDWHFDRSYKMHQQLDPLSVVRKIRVLDGTVVSSVGQAVEGLNEESLWCPENFCLAWSSSSQCYFLLWRQGHEAAAFAAVGLTEDTEDAPVSTQSQVGETVFIQKQVADIAAVPSNAGPGGSSVAPVDNSRVSVPVETLRGNGLMVSPMVSTREVDYTGAFKVQQSINGLDPAFSSASVADAATTYQGSVVPSSGSTTPIITTSYMLPPTAGSSFVASRGTSPQPNPYTAYAYPGGLAAKPDTLSASFQNMNSSMTAPVDNSSFPRFSGSLHVPVPMMMPQQQPTTYSAVYDDFASAHRGNAAYQSGSVTRLHSVPGDGGSTSLPLSSSHLHSFPSDTGSFAGSFTATPGSMTFPVTAGRFHSSPDVSSYPTALSSSRVRRGSQGPPVLGTGLEAVTEHSASRFNSESMSVSVPATVDSLRGGRQPLSSSRIFQADPNDRSMYGSGRFAR